LKTPQPQGHGRELPETTHCDLLSLVGCMAIFRQRFFAKAEVIRAVA